MKLSARSKKPYGIVGDGKASRHLQSYFRLLKTPYILWRRSDARPAAAVLKNCEKIFILIDDSALEGFIRRNPFLKDRILLHFSGSLEIKSAFSLHPFMPLASRTLSLQEYRDIPFALDAAGPALKDLVPEFRNPSFRIEPGLRPLYHALCVLGANLPIILWQKTLKDLNGQFKIPRGIVLNYFRASLENFISDPDGGLSGPLLRRDRKTVRANLQALDKDAFKAVYAAFAKLYIKIC